jgi:hypothetical protein
METWACLVTGLSNVLPKMKSVYLMGQFCQDVISRIPAA